MDLRIDNTYETTYPNVHLIVQCTNNSGASPDCFSGEVLYSNIRKYKPGYYSKKWFKHYFKNCESSIIMIIKSSL